MDRLPNALDFVVARLHPGLNRGCAGRAVADHGCGKPPLGVADRIPRPVERQPVEIIRNRNTARGAGHAVEATLDAALPEAAAATCRAREAELAKAGVPAALARHVATLPALAAAPDIVMVADRTGQNIAEVAATYFAAEAFFRLDHIAGAARGIVISDYFDRLALDRALDSIGDAERRLTAAMAGNGAAGGKAVEAWVAPRRAKVDRIRMSVHEIANSGLTLSKLSVAASLLGDLVKS